jgi:ATP-dependent Clp protease ATP-binding subunit ClpC
MSQVADPYPPSGLLRRFTLPARLVLARAKDEARFRHHGRVETEHLLLGLIYEADSVTGQVLEQLDVAPRDVGFRLDQILRYGDQRLLCARPERPPAGAISFTTAIKRALRLGLQESVFAGDRQVGTGHMLLGVLRAGDQVANDVLINHGVHADRVRAQLCVIYGRGTASSGTS